MLSPGTKEECGTFEPLQQPFSVLIVVSWQEIGVHWFRTPAASLHKSQTGCVLHAAIMQTSPGGPVLCEGLWQHAFACKIPPMMKLMKHSHDFNRRLQSSNLDLPLCLINSVRKLPLLQTLWHGGVLTLLSIYRSV